MKKILFIFLILLNITWCSYSPEWGFPGWWIEVRNKSPQEEADTILYSRIDTIFWSWVVEKHLKKAKKELLSDYPLEGQCWLINYTVEEKKESINAVLKIRCSVWVRNRTSKDIEYKLIKEKEVIENNSIWWEIHSEVINNIDTSLKDDIKINDYVKYWYYIGKVILISNDNEKRVYIDWLFDYCWSGFCPKSIKETEIRKLNSDELNLYINNN